ncbi:MAG: UDP-N-acetylmuramoyl-L-alanine--D-glutamate ligase [Chloroflexi bacterium]|nr:UDP-N-acetylmuramoyl-L-alanine--D-glutamate ligase [Chloroflexota bacterium]MYJ57476.1 UDP-N-acetylmuramoyl-L-alanine--D-glutamate ligase [Chloroflexota bacterium]
MTLPTPTEAPPTFNGQKVAVVGLGIEGRDAVTFLEREGSEIVRIDRNPERADRDQDDLGILDEVDGIIASQGVHYQQPLLAEADRRGVPVYGPTQIFLERCPAPVLGITGSAGKTTTTTLVHLMLQAAGVPCQLGGNIGRGLLAQLPDLSATDTVVAELSHTQLLRTTRSPRTAAITNITPNHLDQFSWEEYQELKYRIVEYQSPSDTVVLPFDDELAAAAAARTEAAQRWFGIGAPGMPWYCAVRSSDGKILNNDRALMSVEEIKLPGEHNLLNALAALAIVADLVPDDVAIDVLRNFSGVPHRLELIAEIECVRFINDSIATTPERTLAGLRATPGPVILLLGGRDKNLPLDPLIDEIRSHVRRVVLFGESAPSWTAWLRERDVAAEDAGSFESAVRRAADCARPNDTVLMSPGGTSFDAYPNFEARGRHFRELVEELARASEVVQ